jgi:hypothetical protein
LGRASTTVPSISITPSFFGMSSTIRLLDGHRSLAGVSTVDPGTSGAGAPVDLVEPPVDLIPDTQQNASSEARIAL